MDRVFIAKGDGYASGSLTGTDGRCTVFDGFEVIAEPLPTRESRVLGRKDGEPGTGTDYGSHSIKLAVRSFDGDRRYKGTRQLYILMENGSGREVLAVKTIYDRGETERALLAMPEAALYGALYIMWDMASDAARQRASETRTEWAQAYVDGRIRKQRKGGRITVHVETPFERDLRIRKAAPSRMVMNLATGELTPA